MSSKSFRGKNKKLGMGAKGRGINGMGGGGTFEQRLRSEQLGVKERLGSAANRKPVNMAAIARGGIDLRRKLNEKGVGKTEVDDLRNLLSREPSMRLTDSPSSPMLGGNVAVVKKKLLSPILAAAVSDIRGGNARRNIPARPRLMGGRIRSRPETSTVLPGKSKLAAIQRTVENIVEPENLRFTVRNTVMEKKFHDLTISRNFPGRKKPPPVRRAAMDMEVEEEEEMDEEDEEEERYTPPLPPPKPKAKKVPAAALKPKKVQVTMNTVRIRNLPENVTTKEVTELCEDFGEITRVSRVGKGDFEIDFEREEDARKTVVQCSQATLDGVPLEISLLPSSAPAKSTGAAPSGNSRLKTATGFIKKGALAKRAAAARR